MPLRQSQRLEEKVLENEDPLGRSIPGKVYTWSCCLVYTEQQLSPQAAELRVVCPQAQGFHGAEHRPLAITEATVPSEASSEPPPAPEGKAVV